MRVLVVTNMYPSARRPSLGTFVRGEVDSLEREGIQSDVLFIDGPSSRLNYLWGLFRFWGRLVTRRYDLIHAHYVFCGIISRMQFLYPVVLTHHLAGVRSTREMPACRLINRLVDIVVDRSEEIRRAPGFEMIKVIPAGIDLDLFRPMPKEECRASLGLPLNKRLVLWAGDNRRPEKRFDLVTESVSRLQRVLPQAELLVASGKPQNQVPLYMNACDALLLMSDGEGSPNVVKEAMACNLPVVSVPVGDVPEIIGGTEGCYLCSQDPQDAANKLASVLVRGQRTAGRTAISHLELGVVARRFAALYQELLRQKRGRGLARLWFWQSRPYGTGKTAPAGRS